VVLLPFTTIVREVVGGIIFSGTGTAVGVAGDWARAMQGEIARAAARTIRVRRMCIS
jgi:hypothetical protein